MAGALSWQVLGAALVLMELLALASVVHAIMSTRTSQGAIAWSLSLITFPFVSLPLYWIFGRNRFRGYARARRALEPAFHETLDRLKRLVTAGDLVSVRAHPNFRVLERLAAMPFTRGHSARLLIDGESTFEAIFAGIETAQRYILVQFFIIRDDELGRELAQRLSEKARAGVRVHLLYDEIGSIALGQSYIDRLRDAGVVVSAFNTTRGWRNRFQLNFRNHRKIVVVDGMTAFIGGHNVGDEYLGRDPSFGHWRDTHVRVDGPASVAAQLNFAEDWYWATRELLDLDWRPAAVENGDQEILLLATGPLDDLQNCGLFFAHVISSAEQRVWIASPYFVPDEKIVAMLSLAALKGLDVRIVVPARADNRLVHLASFAFISRLKQAGVRFYRYEAGFMHQKVMLVDDRFVSIGTANLDNRSFRLNFEISVLFDHEGFASEVEEMLENDFARSQEVNLGDYEARPIWFKFAVRCSNLFSPIL